MLMELFPLGLDLSGGKGVHANTCTTHELMSGGGGGGGMGPGSEFTDSPVNKKKVPHSLNVSNGVNTGGGKEGLAPAVLEKFPFCL
jgi:spore coat protein CotH